MRDSIRTASGRFSGPWEDYSAVFDLFQALDATKGSLCMVTIPKFRVLRDVRPD